MSVAVDTSVWISYLRAKPQPLSARLEALLDADECLLLAPVRVELLAGSPRRQFTQLISLFAAFPTFYPDATTWKIIDDFLAESQRAGERFFAVDLLIAALANQHNARVWSLDGDFQRMRKLGFIDLYS